MSNNRKFNLLVLSAGIAIVTLITLTRPVSAQPTPPNSHVFLPLVVAQERVNPAPNRGLLRQQIPFNLQLGTHDYVAAASQREHVVFDQIVSAPDADWMQLHFSASNLGQNSFLRLTSLADGSQQRLDAISIRRWNHFSAYFNGSQVQLELVVGEGDTAIFADVDYYVHGLPSVLAAEIDTSQSPETLCGADSRVASADTRVARLNGACTAWLVSNGTVLTAGHCVDDDPDGSGSLRPDGISDLAVGDVIEFNVPASNANGNINWAAPADQYPIDVNRLRWHFDGEGQGPGKDWAVFAIQPNQNTQSSVHTRFDFYRMTNDNPPADATVRITGYGVDRTPAGSTGGGNAQNQTLQTDTGAYLSESSAGNDIWHSYQVDTEPANSGSPIVWDNTGLTVGIHTNGGCDPGNDQGNSGTSFENDDLEQAIAEFHGRNFVYIDAGHPIASPLEDGTVFRPFKLIREGVNRVPIGGTLSIVKGTYNGSVTINRSMVLTAPVGTVTIVGQ